MKMKQSHYSHMLSAIKTRMNSGGFTTWQHIDEHRRYIINQGTSKDVERRLRWDMTYVAKLTPWICSTLYSYLDDNHIDTALRAIMVDLYYSKTQ